MLKEFVDGNENKNFSERQIKFIIKVCERKLKDVDDVLDDSKVFNIKIT